MYDPYYETKVNPRWGRIPIGSSIGILLILVGLAAIAFSVSDLSAGVTPQNGSAWQENSIWPTIGKGIWVGAILIATGIIGIISNRERTQVSLFVFNALCWLSAVLSLYLILSSILHIEPYNTNGLFAADFRTRSQNVEVAMNSLLIVAGSLGLILSLVGAILSCTAGNCCVDRRAVLYPEVPYGGIPYGPDLAYGGAIGPGFGGGFAPGF